MSRGFTLIELLYTLVVAALVLTIGLPSFQTSMRNSRMSTAVNDVVATLQLARSEAIKRRTRVVVCTNGGNTGADADCDNTAPWQEGWMVFADDDGNGVRGETEQMLRTQGAMRGNVSVDTPAEQPLQTSLSYLPTGFPDLGGLAAAGTMVFCDDRQSDRFGRVISIQQTGRPVAYAIVDRPDLGVTCE